jgi:hypothetical protein
VIVVEVVSEGAERPPAGAPVHVQVLDTTYADAPARVVAQTTAEVRGGADHVLQTVELEAGTEGSADYRVRAHVDVDRDGAVSPGDFVTTAAHQAREGPPVRVVVRKV